MVKQQARMLRGHESQRCLKLRAAGRIIVAAVAALVLAVAGCELGQRQQGPMSGPKGLSNVVDPVGLQRELRLQMDNHLSEVIGTATEIAAAVQDRQVWENCLRWKMRTYDAYLGILSESDPRMAFVHEWANAVELRLYVTSGEGKEIFGGRQSQAVALAKKMEDDMVTLGRKYFPPGAIDAAKDDIEEVANGVTRKVPFGAQTPSPVVEPRGDVLTLLALPLLPVKALESASSTPRAIADFTDTVRDFAAVVQHLPEQTRWQAELLLLEMESTGPMAALTREMDHLEKMQGEAADELHGLANAIFWRGMVMIAAIFVLALAYRRIVRKPRPKQEP